MISKLALASALAGAATADTDELYSSSLYRRDGTGGSHSAPASSYGAPAPSYSAPAPSYSAPEPSYGAPEPSYGAPEPSYSAPAGYSAPAPSYGEASAGLDLTSIIIPILALLGLSLLFPTYVTISGTGRKRRSVVDGVVYGEEDASPLANMVGRVQDMYSAILQSEECIERVACEVGGLASDAGISKSLTKAAEGFVPKKFNKMMKNFNHGKDCSKNNKC